MKGFVFQNENETFLKVDSSGTPLGYTSGVLGNYVRIGAFNDWHYGTISTAGSNYLWTNLAGADLTLYSDFTNGRFGTDTSNPYYNFPSD